MGWGGDGGVDPLPPRLATVYERREAYTSRLASAGLQALISLDTLDVADCIERLSTSCHAC